MNEKEVRRVCPVQDRLVWSALAVFLIVHLSVLLSHLYGPLERDTFVYYSNVTEVATHVFALPSLLDTNVAGVREVVSVATFVSTVYHYLENFTESDQTDAWHSMDRSTATGLIATLFLKFLVHIHHGDAILILLVGIAGSVIKNNGNVFAAAVVATLFMAALFKRDTQSTFQRALDGFIRVLSLGGTTSKSPISSIDEKQLVVALGLNALAVAAFIFGELNEKYDQWSHTVWHAIVYIVVWLIIRILVKARTSKNSVLEGDTEINETLLLHARRGKWRLGTGQWT